MAREQRRNPRRAVRYDARILIASGETCVDCTIADMSLTGAQLVVKDAGALPENFSLLLSRFGSSKRDCEVRWRSGDRVGVRFHEGADIVPKRRAPH